MVSTNSSGRRFASRPVSAALGLAALFVVLLALSPAIAVSSLLRQDVRLTRQLTPLSASTAQIANLMVDQETGERGYVATADPSFLEPYNAGRGQLDALWPAATAQAAAVGGSAPDLLATVHGSAVAWQTQVAEAEIGLVRAQQQPAALGAVASGRGKALFDQFRRDNAALGAYLDQQRAQAASARDADLTRLRTVEAVLVGLGLLALGLLAYTAARSSAAFRRAALAAGEERFRTIVETANEGVWLLGAHAATLLANNHMVELLGTTTDDLAGHSLFDFCFPEDVPTARDRIAQNTRGETQQFDFRFRRHDGAAVFVLAATTPLSDPDGRVVGAIGLFTDITRRRQLEEALRISRDQLQAIFQSVADGVMVQDRSGAILFANDAAAQLCGFPSSAALLASPIADVLNRFIILDESGAPLPRERLPAQRVFRGEAAPSELLRTRLPGTGQEHWSAVRARPVLEEDGQVQFAVSAFQDVMETKQQEARASFLAEASALLGSSLDYETTMAQVARLAVPAFADRCVIDLVDQDGRLRRVAGFQGDPAKDALLQVLLQRYPLDPDGPHPAAETMRTRRAHRSIATPDDLLVAIARDPEHLQLLRNLQAHSYVTVPLVARGQTFGVLSFYRIEAFSAYEPEDLALAQELGRRAALAIDNARLYRASQESLHVRDEFLSSVSHDLRTPLTTIRGLTQLLQRQVGRLDFSQAPHLPALLDDLERASRTMVRMIDDLLDLSRIEAGRPLELRRERIDLVLLARQVVGEQQRQTQRHRLTVEAAVQPITGFWDPLRLERVLVNLLTNAVKYSPDGGDIAVTVAPTEAFNDASNDAPAVVPPSTVSPKDGGEDEGWAVLQVRDGGMGIPAGDLPSIFDRFHRAANATGVQGLGIGLAGARQIVELHGGSIRVESKEGYGSVFTVRLPRGAGADAG